MTRYGDVGEEVIDRLSGKLGCAPNQLMLWQRGLTWHPAGFTQHIWAEQAPHTSAATGWRLHVRTWCLKRVVASSAQMVAAITAELPHNTLSALVRKPGSPSRLGLGASIAMRDDRVEWTSRVLAAVSRLQVHDALRMTQSPAVLESGASPDMAIDRMAVAAGQASQAPPALDPEILPPLPLEALPFCEIAEALRAHDGVRAIATHSGVAASFPWVFEGDRHDFILFEMRVGTRLGLGAGVWVSMSLPLSAPAHLLHALALNEAEMQAGSPTDLIGGWVVRHATLRHESFLPWAICAGEVVRYVADSAVRRAAWLRLAGPSIVPAEWPDQGPGRVLPFRRSL